MQNRIESRAKMFEVAEKLVDIACEESSEGSYLFFDAEIEEMIDRCLTDDVREELVKCLHCDKRVLDVDADEAEICIYVGTEYLENYWEPYYEADYSQNMPCDNYGMGACSPSCPKFYECN